MRKTAKDSFRLCPAAEVLISAYPFYISPKVGFNASIFESKSDNFLANEVLALREATAAYKFRCL